MFEVNKTYTKNDIYELLKVPDERKKGAWDTGYREYEGNIYIFSNVGIPGRTGHDYNNFWDGEIFKWEAKTNSNINQPSIRKMLNPEPNQSIFLFTRTNDKEPFTFEGTVKIKDFIDSTPVKISWQLNESFYYPLDDEIQSYVSEDSPIYEGAVKSVVINKFERNPLARRLCIEHYGAVCNACGFDFYNFYGEIGKGFIHVHHIVPLSKIGKEYVLDPIKDLIPVCPNCHSIIHRGKELVSVEELKSLIKQNY